jgi:F0F1-type ATP synthase delta subunit
LLNASGNAGGYMICGLDKNIYELISSKVYEYVKDYVIAALAVNITDSYMDVQNYWKETIDNLGIDDMNHLIECLKLDDTKSVFEVTCTQIPELFADLYEDIKECLLKVYGNDLINNYSLDSTSLGEFKVRIIDILMKESEGLCNEFVDLKHIENRLIRLIPKLCKTIDSHKNYDASELNRLIIKFLDAWGTLINKYHITINMYLDKIYPTQVESVYSEVMNSLFNNIIEILNKLLEAGEDLSKAYTMLEECFNCLME